MIKLTRKPAPERLVAKMEERAVRLRKLLRLGMPTPEALLSAYRKAELKIQLVAEANGKCIYCESKITHVYFGDVEHIRPKAVFPEERLDMSNLALACAICNNAKSDYWDEVVKLLNPYEDDPNDDLMALGFFVARRPGSDRGRVTIEQLGLNRQALMERRKEKVELLQPLADQYALAPEGPLKELLKRELNRHGQDDAEYAMVVRDFLRTACEIDER